MTEEKFKGLPGWKALGFKSYKDYLASDMWKDKKKLMLSLYPSCQKCDSNIGLNVHHKNYYSVGNEGQEDLIVLCFKCHEEEHGK